MDRIYLDELFGELYDMKDPQDIWDEYDWHKTKGEEAYNDWKWRNMPSVPTHMLDQLVDEFDNDYEWDEVEGVFKQRLGDEFNRRDMLELKEKLDSDLPKKGKDRPKPKI